MAKPATDWERIEAQYRAGTASVREIAAEHGITEGAIRKRAKRDGWERDLSEKVRAKADALVRRELVRTEVRAETPTERQTVEVEASVQARIRIAHRADIGRTRALAMTLLSELEHQTQHQDLYDQLADLLIDDGEDDNEAAKERARKLRDAYNRALSLSGRTETLKKLAETLRILIDKEREAFGIGADAEKDDAGAALRGFFADLQAGGGRAAPVRLAPANPLVVNG